MSHSLALRAGRYRRTCSLLRNLPGRPSSFFALPGESGDSLWWDSASLVPLAGPIVGQLYSTRCRSQCRWTIGKHAWQTASGSDLVDHSRSGGAGPGLWPDSTRALAVSQKSIRPVIVRDSTGPTVYNPTDRPTMSPPRPTENGPPRLWAGTSIQWRNPVEHP